jgi:hypothetical protein
MTTPRIRTCPCGSRHEPQREGFAHRFCAQCELAADIAAEYGREYFAGGFRVPAESQRKRMAAMRERAARDVPMPEAMQ